MPNYCDMALRFLKLIVKPREVTEVFIKGAEVPGRQSAVQLHGYYDSDHLGQLAKDAVAYSGTATAVYFRINPLNSETLQRSPNRLGLAKNVRAGAAKDITRRRLMMIDVDRRR